MRLRYVFLCLFSTLCLLAPAQGQQRATLTGIVTDANDGGPLTGANVILDGTSFGSASDLEGRYTISGLEPGTYTVVVRYIGYDETQEMVTLSAGQTLTQNFELAQGGFDLNTVVITASRQAEKVLDAPASISVLSAQEIETDVTTSAVNVLRNTTGVDISQTGIDRREVVLRGFNNAFSSGAFALVDYRQAAAPALAVNMWSVMPITNLDIERVEVVRGPGSALYGAGVDAGVIHFLTKDPFSHPGTAFSLQGGTRATIGGQFRHAGVVNERLGYKIVGEYLQADEWELDPDDTADALQLASDVVPRNYDYQKYKVNGEIQYRFTDQVRLAFNAGTAALRTPTLSGIGTLQADGFGYSFGQVRLQAGAFFAQAFLNVNDAGDSFVYGQDLDGDGEADPVVDKGRLFSAQVQYDLSTWQGRQQFIFGADFESINPDTEGTINGRNEDDDTISETGLYVQSTTALTDQFDLTLALRGDYNNIVEDFQLSPRAAVVYKPTVNHTLRATFNRAFSSPGSNSNFLDIVARTPDAALPITIRGRGSADGFTFVRNPAFAGLAGSDLVASSLNPATLGQDQPVGLPLDAIYAQLYQGLTDIPTAALAQLLRQQLGLTAQALPDALVAQVVALLSPDATTVQGFSQGQLALLNPSDGSTTPISDVQDIQPLKQTTSSTVELGYKGIVGNRLLLAVDGYYVRKENFVGPLLMETPFVLVPTLQQDLAEAFATGVADNQTLAGALAALAAALPPEQAGLLTPQGLATLVIALAGDQLPSSTTPVAIVQAQENNGGPGVPPELMLAYRNFGELEYYGVDVSAEFLATDDLRIFGNLSWVSDDFFDNEELGEEDENLSLALNAPSFKTKLGFGYDAPSGFSVNLAGRYAEGFPVRSGPYVGEVDSYFLLDVGGGYAFSGPADGLRVDVSIENVLNNEVRQFVGAPEIGVMGMTRVTYSF
ncbi:MAG: TonB-dependent receptor [Bacteroidota bacterium]